MEFNRGKNVQTVAWITLDMIVQLEERSVLNVERRITSVLFYSTRTGKKAMNEVSGHELQDKFDSISVWVLLKSRRQSLLPYQSL